MRSEDGGNHRHSVQVSPTLTGREPELARLRDAVSRVAGGDPEVVVLSGLPGVGKTRLAHETLQVAEAAGFASFAGRCDTVTRDVAYAPFVQAFGPALRTMTEVRRRRLIGDLPQMGLLVGGLGLPRPEPLGDPGLERARLSEGFLRLVNRLAHQRPVALLIDDAHAADAGTATLVRRLLAGTVEQPVLLVCTARSGEQHPDAGDTLTAELPRAALHVEHLHIDPLAEGATVDLATALLGAPLEEPLANLVSERCAGRPLLIEAVTRTLTESGALQSRDGVLGLRPGADLPLPAGIQAQLRIRLSGTGAAEQGLVQALAVAGEADVDVLGAAVGLSHARLFDAVDRLQERGLLIVPSPPGPCRLAHGLLREAVLAGLSTAATQRTHAALVRALRGRRGDRLHVAEHALAAGPFVPPAEALGHLRAGAARAHEVGLTEAAVGYLSAAVDLASRAGDTGVLAEVLADLGAACQRFGAAERAVSAWTEAATAYGECGDPIGTARAHRELAMLAWARGDVTGARRLLEEAERSLAGLEPTSEHAWLLHARVVCNVRLGDVDGIRSAAVGLRALAAELDSPSVAARAFLAEGALRYTETDYVAADAVDRCGLDAALAGDEPLLMLRAHDQLSVVAGAQLDLAGLREHSEASIGIADRLGSSSLAGWPRGRLAVVALLSGDWGAAMRAITELATAVEHTEERRGLVSMLAIRGWILTRHGRLDSARQALDQADHAASDALRADHNIFAIVALAEATWALAADDCAGALAQRSVLEDLTSGWLPLLGLVAVGEAAVRGGNPDDGRAISARLRGLRSCATPAPMVLADWLDGLADGTADSGTEGTEPLMAAATGFDRLGLPFYAARARLAAAHFASGHPQMVAEARTALGVFERLGADREAEAARALLRSRGITPSRGRPSRSTGSALSARELDVGRLVATGLSNAEVATRLFISPRTVGTHLDRIYGKLGLSSRVALTRYLADAGLLDDAAVT